ncbi:tetratricopeptide repeat protein [Marinicella sediminis]|uniref:Tetratricopeptide repeat protein n=1 Tax=Marinicella sediminis TaxID=1792834 RepID=A0ABV7J9C6_9GAMM|nr:tetratricopeptide repeat protein [Marinicella sediminis]
MLITVDTTRPDRLEPYGNDQVATPALQNLANRGIVFEQAWAVAPITLVSHASILSGLYPFQHGVRNNGTQYVDEEITTLAERLKDSGYQTSAFVSAAVLDKRYGLAQGFDVYDDDLSDRRNVSPRMVADRIAESTVNATMEWLDSIAEDQPFFSWVHFYDPHANYSPPPPFRDEYRNRLYDGEIAYMDAQIGRLLEHPKMLAAGDEAPIIMVIADHGESLGEHGEKTHALLAYDSTLHIPFIMHIPGMTGGVRIKESVGHVDVMPTLLNLVDLPAQASDDEMAGRDLTPLLAGQFSEPNRAYYSETYLPYYTYGWEKLRVMRKGRWKLIEAPENELYDLMRDPRELSNVIEQHSNTSYDMQRDLTEWLEKEDSGTDANLSLSADELAKLRSLGYLSVGSGRVAERENRPNPMAMIGQHVGLERARMLLADRFYQQAVTQLQNVLRKDPQNLAALIDLVRAHEGLGEVEQAIEHAEHALELDPEYTQTYLTLARLESQRNDMDKALELVELAINLDPINPESKILKATFLNKTNDLAGMGKILSDGLKDNPEHPRLNAVYAHLVEARSGMYEDAEKRLKSALERDPYLDQAWRFMGQLQERMLKPKEAEASYRRGLQSRPDDPELHGALGHLLARSGRFEAAESQLREAIRLSKKPRTELHLSLGGMLSQLGRPEEAQKEYQKVLAINPEHPGARNNAAIALYRSGKTQAAKELLVEVIKTFPNQADAHNNLAAIAVDQKDWQAAIKHSQDTIKLAPNLVESWNNLAIAQEETGLFSEARQNYEKVLSLDADYWPGYYNLGLLMLKMNDHEAAKDAFNEVLFRVPNHVDSHLELGFLYADVLKDKGMALNHLNAFLRHGGDQHHRVEEVRMKINGL